MSKKESAIINEIDKARLKLSIEHYIKYFIGKRTSEINKDEALNAIALAVREFAMDKMYETMARYNKVNSKRIYYLSIEYLIGRSLENNLHNLGLFNILKSIKSTACRTSPCRKFLTPNMTRRWQRRTGTSGCLLSGLNGVARHPGFRLRHQLSVRPV